MRDEKKEKDISEESPEKEKQLAFIANILLKVITDQFITSNEDQALANICNELPDVEADEFRW